jgi:hypothetical protein
MATDDGGRLWVNNQLVMDYWAIQPAQPRETTVSVPGGATSIRMEYFESAGDAAATLSWEIINVPVAFNNWRGEYYNNITLGGTPVLVRDDASINFDWRDGSPAPGVVYAEGFSARWTRALNLAAGWYRFSMTVDDGGRLWVNDQLVIDEWRVQSQRTFAANVYVAGGSTSLRMEYFDQAGFATAILSWAQSDAVIHNWRAEYFNNTALSGSPALLRDDAEINFNWAEGSPAPGVINNDNFAVRWTRTVNLPAGRYRFVATSDDGARLWVNDRQVVNAWGVQPATANSADIDLPGGATSIRLEYFDSSGLASVQLVWAQLEPDPSAGAGNWRGEYFNNPNLSGPVALVRDDAEINFNWGDNSPAPGTVNADLFSVRWTRNVDLPEGWYRFTIVVDDGGRLYINNRLLIDAWQVQGPRPYDGEVYLPGGNTSIRLEYFENNGWASAQLAWLDIPQATMPQVTVVDDTDAGFERNDVGDWSTAPEGYGNRLTWSRNSDALREGTNAARWRARLAPGRYEVFVYIPERYTTTAQARYIVSHQGGRVVRALSQAANGNRWVSLGTYTFSGGDNDYVELTDVTSEPNSSLLIAFDAIRWEPR